MSNVFVIDQKQRPLYMGRADRLLSPPRDTHLNFDAGSSGPAALLAGARGILV